MKVAQVYYEGSMQSKKFKGPSGELYRMKNPMGGDARPVTIEKIADAKHYDQQGDPFKVEWTALGLIARSAKSPLETLKELGYRKKQRLAKQFDIQANQTEEDLEDDLEPYVKELEDKIN
jgi:hypothetical protein